MKYNENNKPLVCMATKSSCYNGTTVGRPVGVLWHSTGANNPRLSRYVQPSPNDPNREKLIQMIGKNTGKNDWNNYPIQCGLNAWIGKMADGSVATIQTLPWNYRPWGCGSGKNGSCNGNKNIKNSKFWLQFEICEGNLKDKDYFEKVYKEAVELTAYWCKMFNLDPNGTVNYNGKKVPVILCHYDSYWLGLGSNHGDVEHWFKLHGKTMKDVRKDVSKLISESENKSNNPSIATLTKRGIIDSPDYWEKQYCNLKYLDILIDKLAKSTGAKKVNSFKDVNLAIKHLSDCVVIGTPSYWVENYSKIQYLDILLIKAANHVLCKFPYKVKVTASALNIRKGVGTKHAVRGVIRDNGVYTIVDEIKNGDMTWGLLKSYKDNRDGWISLKYCKKI